MEGWLLDDFQVSEGVGVQAKLLEVNEDEDGKAHNDGSDRQVNVSAKYLVGCDGPASTVAKKLKIRFDGLLNLANTKSLLVEAPGLYEKIVNSVGNTHQYQVSLYL